MPSLWVWNGNTMEAEILQSLLRGGGWLLRWKELGGSQAEDHHLPQDKKNQQVGLKPRRAERGQEIAHLRQLVREEGGRNP